MIVTDEEMPCKNGSDALREIKAMFAAGELDWPPCPMVIVTGDTDAESEVRFKEAGAVRVLHKPLAKPQLRGTLLEVGVMGAAE